MKDKIVRQLPYVLLLLVFVLHLPFLTADPDYYLSDSRDAFTDEGLNTSQLRNYINHGQLDFNECDNLIKTLLFNGLLFLPLKILGTEHIVARVTILLSIILLLFISMRSTYIKSIIAILSITTLLQYFVFQYSHFSLSEMISTVSIMVGIFFLYQYIENRILYKNHLLFASVFIAVAYYAKIQFIYIMPLIPIVMFVSICLKKKQPLNYNGPGIKDFAASMLWMFLLFSIYLLFWYWPNYEIFNYVLNEEASGKYATLLLIPRTVAFNIIYVLFSSRTWPANLLFAISFVTGCILFFKSRDRHYRILFAVVVAWLIVESHKLTMIYLPARYLVSYYFAAGLMSSIVIHQILFIKNQNMYWRYAGATLLLLFMINNSIDYVSLFKNRKFNISEVNKYLEAGMANPNQNLALGPWAPSLTWKCKAISKPVWHQFFNDVNLLEQNPRIIISEPGEADSNQAYSLQNISLEYHADSSRTFTIGKWMVTVFWMKPAQ
jgi:hypothetical protein